MLARLDSTLLREILSWVSLPDVFRTSTVSYKLNQRIFNAVNVYVPEGRAWWQAFLERDYGDMLSDALLPNEKYMCYFGSITDRVSFALEYNPKILDVLGNDVAITQIGDEDDVVETEDIIWLLDRKDARVDNMVWRMIKFDARNYPSIPLPIYPLVALSRIDIAERLLRQSFLTPAMKQRASESLIETYKKYPSPELLQLFSRTMGTNEEALYTLMYKCIELSVPNLLEVVLNAIPRDGKGKIRDSYINRNQGMPLQFAAQHGNSEVVRLLIKAGASPYTYKHAAFATAAKYKRTEVMKALSKYLSKSNPVVVAHFAETGMDAEGQALIARLETEGKLKHGSHILVH